MKVDRPSGTSRPCFLHMVNWSERIETRLYTADSRTEDIYAYRHNMRSCFVTEAGCCTYSCKLGLPISRCSLVSGLVSKTYSRRIPLSMFSRHLRESKFAKSSSSSSVRPSPILGKNETARSLHPSNCVMYMLSCLVASSEGLCHSSTYSAPAGRAIVMITFLRHASQYLHSHQKRIEKVENSCRKQFMPHTRLENILSHSDLIYPSLPTTSQLWHSNHVFQWTNYLYCVLLEYNSISPSVMASICLMNVHSI